MSRTPSEVAAEIAEVMRTRQLLFLRVSNAKIDATNSGLPIDKRWWAAIHNRIAKVNAVLAKLYVERAEVAEEVKEKKAKRAAQQALDAEEAKRQKAIRIAESEARRPTYERQFINTARRLLTPEAYKLLVDETHISMGEEPPGTLKSMKDAA